MRDSTTLKGHCSAWAIRSGQKLMSFRRRLGDWRAGRGPGAINSIGSIDS